MKELRKYQIYQNLNDPFQVYEFEVKVGKKYQFLNEHQAQI